MKGRVLSYSIQEEGIIYLVKTDEEFEQTYIIGKKEWF